MKDPRDLTLGTGRRFHTPAVVSDPQYYDAHDSTGSGIASSSVVDDTIEENTGDCCEDLQDCELAVNACEAEKEEIQDTCDEEKQVLQDEIDELQDELDAANSILEGSCFTCQTRYTVPGNPGPASCKGITTTSDGLMCYADVVNDRYTFSLVVTKVQDGEPTRNCGRKLSIFIEKIGVPASRKGGDSSGTITIGAGYSSGEWRVFYTNDQVFVGEKDIGTITLGNTSSAGSTPPIYHPLNSSSNT